MGVVKWLLAWSASPAWEPGFIIHQDVTRGQRPQRTPYYVISTARHLVAEEPDVSLGGVDCLCRVVHRGEIHILQIHLKYK